VIVGENEEGELFPIPTEVVLGEIGRMLRLVYFDYAIEHPKPEYKKFRSAYVQFVKTIFDEADNIYADHLEGIRRNREAVGK
jgi:hypothetical protein